MLRLSHRPALVSCFGDAAVLPLCPGLSCLCSSTLPFLLFALNMLFPLNHLNHRRLAATACALAGMVDTNLHLLLPVPLLALPCRFVSVCGRCPFGYG
jgi:hypothetical protein